MEAEALSPNEIDRIVAKYRSLNKKDVKKGSNRLRRLAVCWTRTIDG